MLFRKDSGKKTTELIAGFSDLSYVERLKKLCLTTVKMRRLRRGSSEMSCHCVYVSCSLVIHVVTDRC